MNDATRFAGDRQTIDIVDGVRVSRRRTWWISAVVIVVLALIAGIYAIATHKPAAAAKAAAGDTSKQAATVSVVVPGRQTVDRVISATGNLAARREMPIGVAGEGGMVTQVLVEPGTWVQAGQVLATIDRRVQTQQAASLAASISVSDADARIAQSNLDRALALVSRGFISKADVDAKTATRDAARARVQVARAQLAQAQATAARLDIRAPAAGLVLERRVEPGQIVSPASGMLFRMAKDGQLEMLARLSEGDLSRVGVGARATVTPVGTTQGFHGQVWQLPAVIDPQTRQGIARVALPYDKALRPGGFAAADIVSGAADVPLLPESAVLSDSKGSYVYIVDAANKVERRDVKVGDVSDAGITILSGLTGQEAVVLSAGAFLNPGEKIIPQRTLLTSEARTG